MRLHIARGFAVDYSALQVALAAPLDILVQFVINSVIHPVYTPGSLTTRVDLPCVAFARTGRLRQEQLRVETR